MSRPYIEQGRVVYCPYPNTRFPSVVVYEDDGEKTVKWITKYNFTTGQEECIGYEVNGLATHYRETSSL